MLYIAVITLASAVVVLLLTSTIAVAVWICSKAFNKIVNDIKYISCFQDSEEEKVYKFSENECHLQLYNIDESKSDTKCTGQQVYDEISAVTALPSVHPNPSYKQCGLKVGKNPAYEFIKEPQSYASSNPGGMQLSYFLYMYEHSLMCFFRSCI